MYLRFCGLVVALIGRRELVTEFLFEHVHDEPQAALLVADEDRYKNDRRR
ncbi:MAG: hypothetical protein LC775_20685 [Acidobacteria bacterium]|nr:hypothetical protein [Acidobacteriota bacterium]